MFKLIAVFLLSFFAVSAKAEPGAFTEFGGLYWTRIIGASNGNDGVSVVTDNSKSECMNVSHPSRPNVVFRPPTKDELLAVVRAKKLSIEGQASPYGIWTSTEEMFTHPNGKQSLIPVRCTLEGVCNNNHYAAGSTATAWIAKSFRANFVCVLESGKKAVSQQVDASKNDAQSDKNLTAKPAPSVTKGQTGRVVNTMLSGGMLEEDQAKTWCKRKVPEYKKSIVAEGSEILHVGSCTCEAERGAALQKTYRCSFPVRYRTNQPPTGR
jgi:hypothetical protein